MKAKRVTVKMNVIMPWPYALLSILVFLLAGAGSFQYAYALHQYTGGNRFNLSVTNVTAILFSGFYSFREIEFSEVLRWLIVVSPPLLITGTFLSMQTGSRMYFMLIRKKSISVWWTECYLTILLSVLVYVLISFAVVVAIFLVNGNRLFQPDMDIGILLYTIALFTFYLGAVAAVQSVLTLIFNNIKAILLFLVSIPVLTILTGLISEQVSSWFPGSWGMALRSISGRQYFNFISGSSDTASFGFSPFVVLGLETVIIVLLFFLGRSYLKRNGIKTTGVE